MKDAVYLVKNQQRIITYKKRLFFVVSIETNDDE